MPLVYFSEQLGCTGTRCGGIAKAVRRLRRGVRNRLPSVAVSVAVLFGSGCAQSALAQAINLGPQVKGVLPVGNGGFGIDTQGLTGCPAENNGVWTVSAANCATAGNGVNAIQGPSGMTTGTVYLTGNAVSQSGSTFTITNSGGTLTNLNTGTWPSWLTPTITTGTTTPTLSVSATSIPNSALAGPFVQQVTGPSSTVNGSVVFTGSGVSQSGNTFTFQGSCPSGTCVQTDSATSQTINQNGSSFGVSVNNGGTALNSPITDLNLGLNSDGPGYYVNNGPWAGHSAIGISFLNNSPGIDQGIHGNFTDLKTGDAAWEYDYLLYYGGAYFGSDEGLQAINLKPQQVGYFQGTLTTPTAGSLYQPDTSSAAGYTQLFTWNSYYFPGPGVLASVTLAFVQAPTAQTDYIVIWTPNSGNQATINAVLPVSVAATTGNQTFTSSNFGTVHVPAGSSIGFYTPSGPGVAYVNSESGSCSASSGVPVVGPITVLNTNTTSGACGGSGGIVMQAILAAPTTGSQGLAVTGFSCNTHAQGCSGQAGWEWATGGILLDMQNSTPTQATFVSQPNTLGITMTLGTDAVTESTAWGTVGSCTPDSNNANNQVPQTDTCNITLGTSPASPGNFVAGQDACVAGWYQEELPITSVGTTASGVQQITFTTYHNWGDSGSIIMQGGPCGQFVVNNNNLVSGTNFWPVAYQVLGALATNEIVLANCVTGGCTGAGTTPNPGLLYSGLQNANIASLTRTNNVVSASPDTSISSGAIINTFPYPVGATINVTGCTVDTDLNGTYTITASSQDNMNPVLQWAQTGSNEGPDTTCTINSGYPTFTFYPGAFINSSSSATGITVQQNQVPWNSGDLIREAPASTYNENDIVVTHGQSSMPYNNESQLILQDLGPSLVNSNITVTNNAEGTGSGSWLLTANGSWNTYFGLSYVPLNNGCIICEGENNPGKGSYPPPYYLFNGGGDGQILVDTVHQGFFIPQRVDIGQNANVGGLGIHGWGAGTVSAADTLGVNLIYGGTLNFNGENPATNTFNFYNVSGGIGLGLGSGTTFNSIFTVANATGQMNFAVQPTVNGTPLMLSNDSTLAVSSGTLAANTCTAAASVSINGVNTSGSGSHISAGYTSDPATLTGWGAVGGMVFHIWPSAANTAEWEVCNQTNASIAYSGITFSIGVE